MDREIAKLQKFFQGVAEMDTLPDVMFVVDSHKEEVAVLEAVRMKIPVVAMVDTNGRAWQLDKIIPVNDDAVKSIELCVEYIGDAVYEGVNGKKTEVKSTGVETEVKTKKKAKKKEKDEN